MDQSTLAPVVAQLAVVLGAHAASVIGAVAVLLVLVAHGLMPWLPVATGTSPAWYGVSYGILRVLAGNYRNAAPAGTKGTAE